MCGVLLTLMGLILGNLWTSQADGADLQRVYFETSKLHNYRHTYMPEYTLLKDSRGSREEVWSYHVGLGLDLDLITTEAGTLYWNQLIEGESTTRQFRRTAWLFEIGIDFGDVSLYHNHRSEHLLDAVSDQPYPLRDMYGLRVCFAGSGC